MSESKFDKSGNSKADGYRIVILERGPFMVYGRPPLAEQFIMVNEMNESWYFQEGKHFSTETEPTALCRCGDSRDKPYCDGRHTSHQWPAETAPETPSPYDTETVEGKTLTMTDEHKYCVFARFCEAAGGVWELLDRSDDPSARRMAIRETMLCPGGRLTAHDNVTGKVFEPEYEAGLGLIEDHSIGASGGLWVHGGIRIERKDGNVVATRNRVVLCRCGHSSNMPYCDGTHASLKWRDDLEGSPAGETIPEEVH